MMNLSNLTEIGPEGFQNLVLGGTLGALLGVAIILGIIFALAIYVYTAIAWQTIAMRQGYKHPWFAWIPFLNLVMILELGGFHWAWVFLILIPVLGWIAIFVLSIIAIWRIFEKEKYPGWFSLAPIIPKAGGILFLIALGFVAWKPKVKKKITKRKKEK